ncbi:hypothetical protein [Sphingobacterium paludis]|uniref:Glycosyl hydrolase family 18 (Putative chitinase) n=1 Tax=Sphingobacterium paludis TaxID=1476465 RepID=A0A4R7CTJ9_9SPHI|nr:hypothetical protein [Sphingobacterium paludis]TDS11038.1 hypothetical protein B0I21_10896 [Sphingobacterium paludis]
MKIGWITLIVFFCCCSHPSDLPSVSFYYWKTNLQLGTSEENTLRQNHTGRLYVRYFDVGLQNGEPFPISAILFKTIPKQDIVPVVYIKNEVVLSKNVDMAALAKRIVAYLEQINVHYGIHSKELQLDCDWSLGSKAKFFELVHALKQQRPWRLSCTIRLHQVKYFEKTGVPDVDYGVLMYYNMGQISANQTNSIYDRQTAATYIKSLSKYPLPLNIALPIFSWGVHLRQGKVINLLRKIDETDLRNHPHLQQSGNGIFKIRREGIYFGQLFAAGDEIKLENVAPEDLLEMANDLSRYLREQPDELIFYDLDSTNIDHYDKEIFQQTAHRFR